MKINTTRNEFKPSIFKEGMRQIKIGGIVYTIICTLFTLFQMLDSFSSLTNSTRYTHLVSQVNAEQAFEEILLFTVLLAVIFMAAASLMLMSFLRSGKARDFYCSTPNSICTLWMSFATAVFAWTAIGIGASAVVELPFMLILDAKMIGLWFTMLIGLLAVAFFFCGIIMLALTLTGKIIPAIVTGCGIAFLPAMLWFVINSSFNGFFAYFNFIPRSETAAQLDFITNILNVNSNYYNRAYAIEALCSVSTISFHLVIGAVYIAVAAIFATVRTGDAAGRPFVNKAAHFISLMIVTFDGVGVIVCVAMEELHDVFVSFENFMNPGTLTLIVFCVIAAVIMYWVCELLITFDIKKSYIAFKFIPIPVVVALAITCGGYLYHRAQICYAPSADEVDSFTLVRNERLDDNLAVFRMNNTLGRAITNETQFKDDEIINYVVGEINTFVNTFNKKFSDAFEAYDAYSGRDNDLINIRLNLKNGKTVTRTIKCDSAFSKKIADAIKRDSDFMSKFLTLPDKEFTNIGLSQIDGLDDDDITKIYESFKNEYNAMSESQRFAYVKYELAGALEDNSMYYSESENSVYNYDNTEQYDTATPPVSESDIRLIHIAKTVGDYNMQSNCIRECNTADEAISMSIILAGYKDSKFYNQDMSFEQSYSIKPSVFPETTKLIITLCNNRIDEFKEIPNKINKKHSWLNITASYFNGKDIIEIGYDYADETDIKYQEKANHFYDYDTDSYYAIYHENYYEENTKVIEVSDSAMFVNKLFEDASGTDKIDLSKPFAVIHVGYYSKENITRTFFIQTESPLDLLNIER